jgi:hypothetical protein
MLIPSCSSGKMRAARHLDPEIFEILTSQLIRHKLLLDIISPFPRLLQSLVAARPFLRLNYDALTFYG